MKTCDYCQREAVLLHYGAPGYPYQRNYGPTWTCTPCQSWVGCHPGTENALGRLANAELRLAKQAAHAVFDPLWQRKMKRDKCTKSAARKAGYHWLAEQLGLPPKKTHIGYFDIALCQRVVEVCTTFRRKEQ